MGKDSTETTFNAFQPPVAIPKNKQDNKDTSLHENSTTSLKPKQTIFGLTTVLFQRSYTTVFSAYYQSKNVAKKMIE